MQNTCKCLYMRVRLSKKRVRHKDASASAVSKARGVQLDVRVVVAQRAPADGHGRLQASACLGEAAQSQQRGSEMVVRARRLRVLSTQRRLLDGQRLGVVLGGFGMVVRAAIRSSQAGVGHGRGGVPFAEDCQLDVEVFAAVCDSAGKIALLGSSTIGLFSLFNFRIKKSLNESKEVRSNSEVST